MAGGKNASSRWNSSGNLEFLDDDGAIIFTVDGVTRALTLPVGSTLDVAGTLTTGSLIDGGVYTGNLEVTGTLDIDGASNFDGAAVYKDRVSTGAGGIFSLGAGAAATIASGVLTATKSYMIMDAEGAGTTDTLDSITGPGTPADGDILLLVSTATDTITVDDANINLAAATRAVAPGGSLLLRYDGTETQWTELLFVAAADNV